MRRTDGLKSWIPALTTPRYAADNLLKRFRVSRRREKRQRPKRKVMARAIRQHHADPRSGERIPLFARLSLTTLDGKPVAPLSRCTNIGIGGILCTAAVGVAPGTNLLLAVELPTGCVFQGNGHVAWCKTTLHPALFGSPRGFDDDALFGIAFDGLSPDLLLPIARLLMAKQDERRRARRILRRHGFAIHA